MTNLTAVRKEFEHQQVQRMQSYMAQVDLKPIIENFIVKLFNEINDVITDEEPEDNSDDEEFEKMRSMISSSIGQIFENPQQVQKMAEDSVKKQYVLTEKEMEATLEIKNLRKSIAKINPDAVKKYDSLVKELLIQLTPLWDFNSWLLQELVSAANKESVQEALKEDKISAIIRQKLPTKESYFDFQKSRIQAFLNYMSGIQQLLVSPEDAEENEVITKLMDAITRFVNDVFQNSYMEWEAAQIYPS